MEMINMTPKEARKTFWTVIAGVCVIIIVYKVTGAFL